MFTWYTLQQFLGPDEADEEQMFREEEVFFSRQVSHSDSMDITQGMGNQEFDPTDNGDGEELQELEMEVEEEAEKLEKEAEEREKEAEEARRIEEMYRVMLAETFPYT